MRTSLHYREWAALIFLFVLLLTMILVAYRTKDTVDISIENFLKSEKNA